MMIFVDKFGHMISDVGVDELHSFALKIGLKREWLQDHPRHPHYDLTTTRMIKRAVENGAHLKSPLELARKIWMKKG